MEGEMEEYGQKGLQQEQEQQALLRDTEEQLKETQSRAQEFELKADDTGRVLEQIRTGTELGFIY